MKPCFPQIHLARLRPGERPERHVHDTAHACLLVHGSTHDRAKRRGAELAAGEIRFDRPGAPHEVEAAEGEALCLIAEWTGVFGPGAAPGRRAAPALAQRAAGLAAALEETSKPAARRLAAHRLSAGLEQVRRFGEMRARPGWLAEVETAIGSKNRLNINTLARQAGVHRSTLHAAFLGEFGLAPQDYRTLKRLDCAGALLLQGKNQAETALVAGFADQSQMSRAWRAWFGLPPGKWLAAARQ